MKYGHWIGQTVCQRSIRWKLCAAKITWMCIYRFRHHSKGLSVRKVSTWPRPIEKCIQMYCWIIFLFFFSYEFIGQHSDPRCVYVPPSTGKTFFAFRIAYARCGTKPDLNGQFYENTVRMKILNKTSVFLWYVDWNIFGIYEYREEILRSRKYLNIRLDDIQWNPKLPSNRLNWNRSIGKY